MEEIDGIPGVYWEECFDLTALSRIIRIGN